MDIAMLSRRLFIGKLAGAATVAAATPALTLSTEPGANESPALPSTPSRVERLHALFAELRQLVSDQFPEFKIVGDTISGDSRTDEISDFLGFAAFRPEPPKPPVIEYAGPGVYRISLRNWEERYVQVRHVERVPKGHKLAGQFRFRFPDAPVRSHWTYVPEADFRLIQRVEE